MLNKKELLNTLYNTSTQELLGFSREKLSNMFGEAIAIQKDYDQNNPHHCFTLLEHTLRTVDYIKALDMDKADKDILLVTALYHDCGKPASRFDKRGKSVYYSHPLKSKKLAKPLLEQAGFNKRELSKILFLIEYHDMFIPFKLESEPASEHCVIITKSSVRRFADSIIKDEAATLDDIKMLIPMGYADASAQSSEVVFEGRLLDTRSNKLKRVEAVEHYLNDIH